MKGYTDNIHRIAGLVRLRRQPSLFLQRDACGAA
jgi:hypothetical protein